jgi:hypothetical protein
MNVLFISCIERSSRLANIFQWADQEFHLIYTATVIFISVLCFNMLPIVFLVRNATLICVFLKSLVIRLTSFPQ